MDSMIPVIDLGARRDERAARERFLIQNGYKDAPPPRDPWELPRAMVGHVADVLPLKRRSEQP